ncbi:hypothetical protein [Brevibacillus porteri]|uniref:hypothetical protein n=1 Tax=Brevibacillus porteri TaxID=2126350 RepID=UPI003D217EDB
MTRKFDDWFVPFSVRNLRYLRDELAEVDRKLPDARRAYFELVAQKLTLQYAIDDNERYIREKGDDVD